MIAAEPVMTVTPSPWRQVMRLLGGAAPAVVVATLIPLTLFYSLSAAAGTQAGIFASLIWAYAVLALQLWRRRAMSGLLTLTAFTLTVRGVTWGINQSTFTYFAVPVVETILTGALFVGTLLIGRPLLVSLARDFIPSLAEHLVGETYRRQIRHLSCVWAAVYFGSALTSGFLLTTLSLHWFLLLHQASGWIWMGSGLIVSFLYGRRHAGDLLAHVMAPGLT
jgi:intracellular septation protein A